MCTRDKIAWLPKPEYPELEISFFEPREFWKYDKGNLPCGYCPSCYALHALRRAVQSSCELHTQKLASYFFTLTVDPEHLPPDYYFPKRWTQLFIKRLRKKFPNVKIRYEAVGENGSKTYRPHGHLLIYGLGDLPDLEAYESPIDSYTFSPELNLLLGAPDKQIAENVLYESALISKLWGKGSVKIMTMTFNNILYVAQHHQSDKILDKIDGKIFKSFLHPNGQSSIISIAPAWTTRSSKPGIGHDFFQKYMSDFYPADYHIIDGQKKPIPPYFDVLLSRHDLDMYEQVKNKRLESIVEKSPAQLAYQEKYDIAILKRKRTDKQDV